MAGDAGMNERGKRMSEMMKTLVVDRDGKLSVEECPMPDFGPCDALVRTISCGICNGTDSKLIHRTFKGFPEDRYPIMLGHEAVGEVVAIGASVTGYRVGDIVLLPFAGPLGGFGCGWGAFSEYGVVSDVAAYEADGLPVPECAYAQTVVPKEIDPVKAAMIVTLREVLSAIRRFGIGENDDVAVFGCGPVGLTFVSFLSMLGARKVIALDIVPEKLRDAAARGADFVFDAREPDITAKVRAICPDGVGYVIDAVGVLPVINQAMPLLKDQGSICCYGISENTTFEVDWTCAPYNWQLRFQQFPSKLEEGMVNAQILEWIAQGKIDLDDYISDIVDFKDILPAFERVEARQIAKKCIIRYV
jgi:threonine dehydrogenase-like Zn-dependent dehydrogenase